ncbi:plastocyanin/azurin family copper-binding protein [Halogeometricum sp. S1BR25-6]|uniref:Plastocyanin/azurin family copper-binding protein n=1 Tax=Halogeometricum salsisoli TaxID=2950536 RepID=A0ABU2GBI0_9EURY|nr:plastocyanin/azurin family copper-binding protein [Halogeometricum sp. S1BR25-6]MDS0298156.1 plastocyanin/azurin family copper-binding protein [Halogeometricum sp. S1BR25-6]
MKRRDFLRAASVPAATATASAAAGVGAAQEGTSTSSGTGTGAGTGTGTGGTGTGAGTGTGGGGGGGGGASKTVEVGPGGSLVFTPGTEEALQIAPGTTVEFVWMSDNHNVVPDSTPEGANWSGHEPIENEGFTYTHTFGTLGTYEYHCAPHETAGMVGTIEVVENPSSGEGGGEKELEELGVPIQAHWVGAATILGIIVTVIFTFYILKYGESAHTGTGRNG